MPNEKEQIRYGQFRANSVNEEARTAEFVISSEAPDTYNTVFKSDGWDLERYSKNPVVTYQHNDWSSDPDQVIGTSEVRQEGDKLIAVVTFENAEDNPLAEKVFRKVKNGILRGASIRANVHEGHWGDFDEGDNPELLYFTRMDLMSWSIVTVQSNPDALARNAECMETIRSAFAKTEPTTERTDGTEGDQEEKTLSRFEAQYMYNKNLNENEKVSSD